MKLVLVAKNRHLVGADTVGQFRKKVQIVDAVNMPYVQKYCCQITAYCMALK
jgi:hypothetical protein